METYVLKCLVFYVCPNSKLWYYDSSLEMLHISHRGSWYKRFVRFVLRWSAWVGSVFGGVARQPADERVAYLQAEAQSPAVKLRAGGESSVA